MHSHTHTHRYTHTHTHIQTLTHIRIRTYPRQTAEMQRSGTIKHLFTLCQPQRLWRVRIWLLCGRNPELAGIGGIHRALLRTTRHSITWCKLSTFRMWQASLMCDKPHSYVTSLAHVWHASPICDMPSSTSQIWRGLGIGLLCERKSDPLRDSFICDILYGLSHTWCHRNRALLRNEQSSFTEWTGLFYGMNRALFRDE